MKNKKFSLIVLMSLGMFSFAQAQVSPCNTLEECLKLDASVHARIKELSPVVLGPIARNADKTIRYMNQYAAEKYCNDQGGRLPTAKELALALHPKGVSETEASDDFYKISPVGEPAFYYNYKTYASSSGAESSEFLWSSSVDHVVSDFAYVFYGDYGVIYYSERNSVNAVRCVAQR